MDEHTNDSKNEPGIITPDSTGENSETTSAPETPAADNTPEASADTPDESTDATESTETNSDSESEPDTDTTTDSPETDAADKPAEESPDASSDQPTDDKEDSADDAESAPAADAAAPDSSSPAETAPTATPSPETTETPAAEAPASAASDSTDTSAAPSAPDNTPAVDAPSLPDDDSPAPSSTPAAPSAPSGSGKSKKVVIIVAIVVVLAIIAIIAALMMNKSTKTPTSSTHNTTTTTKTAVKVNTWTGKGSDDNWNTAANWSLGAPTNGEDLVISDSAIKAGSTTTTLNDNVPSLSIAKLTISGSGSGFNVSGSPLTVTGGIAQSITPTKGSSSQSAVQLENSVTFTGNQVVSTTANNQLTFSSTSGSTATTTIGSSTVQFIAAKSSDIEVSTPVVGTGEIDIPASSVTTGNVDFNLTSSNFTGNVMVNSGATVGMSNQNATGSGVSSTDAFGTATITVASGGYLEVNEVGSSSITIPNNITIGGNGATSPSQDNGPDTGAISACITSAQEGCNTGATVTLTGKLSLVANTEFGAFYGLDSAQVPPSTTATYVVKDLVANGHTLTTVPNSKAVVQTPSSKS
jgi:hypothetical protein